MKVKTKLLKWLQHLSNTLPLNSATSTKHQQLIETPRITAITGNVSALSITAITSTNSTATLGPLTDTFAKDESRRRKVEDGNDKDRQT